MSNKGGKVQHFYDLKAWQKAYQLALEIYKCTKKFPEEEKFGITSQLRRTANSITANIAEGFGRYHFKDKARFYHQARGSNAEVQSFLLLTKGLKYIDETTYKNLGTKTLEIQKLINGIIRSMQKQVESS